MTKGVERKNLEAIIFATAESIMKKDFVSVSPCTSLAKLINLFNETKANPIPVVNENKILQGIVARSDIIKLVSKFSDAEIDFLRNA